MSVLKKSINKMKDYQCQDCGYKFTLDWHKKRKPYCPDCGESNVFRLYCDNRPRKTEFKRGRWTPDEILVLQRLCKSSLTYAEIGQRLGRSKDAIGQKLKDLMKLGQP